MPLIIFIILMGLNFLGYTQDFSFLKPPSTFYQREQKVNVSGQDIKAYVFQTTLTEADLIDFYDRVLKDKGFTKASEEFQQASTGFFKYTKKSQVINIQIMKAQGDFPGVTVVASVYNQSAISSEGCSACGGGFPSDNSLTSSPGSTAQNFDSITEDLPGEDLEFIPRPPGSIRLVNVKNDAPFMVNIVYKCSQSREELKKFYKQNMDYHYWKLTAEISSSQLGDELKNLTGKLPQGPPVSLDVLTSAYNLYFKGPYGEATIVIMENPQGEGRVVSILYRK
ncbi:MAG: hypothetical protein DRP61_04045 [Candidatus Omnitrophota bacterium]|nr:MAG: hypothetical protein DRP61_04045 [Candidatus Omnitrophota bacterium]